MVQVLVYVPTLVAGVAVLSLTLTQENKILIYSTDLLVLHK